MQRSGPSCTSLGIYPCQTLRRAYLEGFRRRVKDSHPGDREPEMLGPCGSRRLQDSQESPVGPDGQRSVETACGLLSPQARWLDLPTSAVLLRPQAKCLVRHMRVLEGSPGHCLKQNGGQFFRRIRDRRSTGAPCHNPLIPRKLRVRPARALRTGPHPTCAQNVTSLPRMLQCYPGSFPSGVAGSNRAPATTPKDCPMSSMGIGNLFM
jgi:hypothetical protein